VPVGGRVGRRFDDRPVRRAVPNGHASGDWPAGIPAVDQVLREGFEVTPGVTLLYGENGAGKSTLVEALAIGYGFSPEGGSRSSRHSTRASESPLHEWLTLERGLGGRRWGYFLRAESMHGVYTYLEDNPGTYDPSFHEMSHGESFLEILRTRFDSPGFYCLDEPEAALSFSGQMALLGAMHDLARSGAQLVCATHSPLLAALPGARLLEVGEWGIRPTSYDDLPLVGHWKSYLDDPRRYLRHVLDDEERGLR
jgi:predicted ATPase